MSSFILDVNGFPMMQDPSYSDMAAFYRQFDQSDISVTIANFCRSITANSVSRLTLNLYKETATGGRKEIQKNKYPAELAPIAKRPNAFQTWPQFIRSCVLNTLDYGNAYGVAMKSGNTIGYLIPVTHPNQVIINSSGEIYTIPSNDDFKIKRAPRDGLTLPENVFLADEVLHMKAMTATSHKGLSIYDQNPTAFKYMNKVERHGMHYFDNVYQPSGVFETPVGLKPQDYDQWAAELTSRMAGQQNAGKALVLKPGMQWKQTSVDNQSAQYIELREYQKHEIMAAYGVPVGMLQEGGQDFDAARMAFYETTVFSYCREFQDALNRVCPEGYFFEFDTDEFLKGNPLQQIELVERAVRSAIWTPNEARKYMGLEAVAGGDLFAISTNNITLGTFEGVAAQQQARIDALNSQTQGNANSENINSNTEADNGTAQ